MAGIACPVCQSQDFKRYRSPVSVRDTTFRRHQCQACPAKTIFLTAQVVVSGRLAEAMLTLTEQPTSSYGETQSSADTSPLTLLELLRDGDSASTSETLV